MGHMKQTKLDTAIAMFKDDYNIIIDDLKLIQTDLDRGAEIDIRLCIDFDDKGRSTWIIRRGDASYDQRHSDACGASLLSRKDKLRHEPCCDLLEDLIDQCLDQIADSDIE